MLDFATTLALTVGLVLAAAFCGWRGARPPDLRRGPRMIPWRALMLLFGALALLLAGHLATLGGLPIGHR